MDKSNFQTLQGKVAIVTGASRGLGYGFALELARRGAKILAAYTSESSESKVQELIRLASSLDQPTTVVPFRGDLSSPSTPAALVSAAVSAFGPRIDILVNNAAVEVVKPLADLTALDFDRAYHVNVRAPLLLTQAVAPHLPQEGGGRIINISSVGGRAAFANLSLYCSSKAALEGVTRSLAAELGPKGHTVNAVNPGPVQSDMLANIPADLVALQKRTTPMQHRLGEVDDVAQIVAWLASDDSRWVTGQAISASGGLAIY